MGDTWLWRRHGRGSTVTHPGLFIKECKRRTRRSDGVGDGCGVALGGSIVKYLGLFIGQRKGRTGVGKVGRRVLNHLVAKD